MARRRRSKQHQKRPKRTPQNWGPSRPISGPRRWVKKQVKTVFTTLPLTSQTKLQSLPSVVSLNKLRLLSPLFSNKEVVDLHAHCRQRSARRRAIFATKKSGLNGNPRRKLNKNSFKPC